jgi:endoglucanase
MNDLLPFLKQLISAPGLSGYETPVCDLIEAAWRPLTDETYLSRLGSLHGVRHGSGPAPRPTLLLAAHMDAIGLMVSGIDNGFLRLAPVGYLDSRVLPGQIVTVHGCVDLPGVIVQPPKHLLPDNVSEDQVGVEHLLVDTGRTAAEVEQQVRLGDLVSFAQPPLDLGEGFLAGHSLDNRASVAALTQCLIELQGRELHWDVCAVATTQEEENLSGARTAAYRVQPALAVAIDVTFGRGPGSPASKTFPMGEGPTLGWGPVIHPKLHGVFKDLAARLEIPYKMEIMPKTTGTDADALQVSREGVPSMVVSIPLRYMHTPVEVVSIKDIQSTARLLAEFAASLDGNFLDTLVWDD